MKKAMIVTVAAALVSCLAGSAYASLTDTAVQIKEQYGDYRFILDTNKHLWTKAEWEQGEHKKEKPLTYSYSFSRAGLPVHMDVKYEDSKDGWVEIQHFGFDYSIQAKDLKTYFPEVYRLVTAPAAQAFATDTKLTKNFLEAKSPQTLGVVVQEGVPRPDAGQYTLLAFNVLNEGAFVKQPDQITPDTYIKEFTIERVTTYKVKISLQQKNGEWKPLTNIFK